MVLSHRLGWVRATAVFSALLLLAVLFLRAPGRTGEASAAVQSDPSVVWAIGTTDGSSDEFALGFAPSLSYDSGKDSPRSGWRENQKGAAKDPPVYKVLFQLAQAPSSPLSLALEAFAYTAGAHGIELNVNGKRGQFRLKPVGARNLDERQANTPVFARYSHRFPLDASLFRAGANEIQISYRGAESSIYYDSLVLSRASSEGPALEATVEPTLFFTKSGAQLQELTQVVIHHRQPVRESSVTLTVGANPVSSQVKGDGYDFGEQVVELSVPAVTATSPYSLVVTADGVTHKFTGQFKPEKRWRLFAGFKIHNDIGFTDLQPHVQELDGRNTDGVLDLIRQYPFYKFNLETSWLVESYLFSRKPARTRELLREAARNQIGVNALYLNLMTGMCTGEEMYRSLYYSKSLQRKYGVPMKFACITDAPSHTWFTPSVLAENGVLGFANGSNQTRGSILQKSDLNEDSPFYWEGADGRKVMTWFARSYLQFARMGGDDPTIDRLRRTVPQFLARYRRDNYPVDAVLIYGLWTDNAGLGHGGAQVMKEWNETYAFPALVPATDADYYNYVAQNFAGKLPTFRGDAGAYWEDGSASSAAETAINRDTQRLLPVTEMAAALATAFHPAETFPGAEFRDAWKNLMFYDEHTWGSHRSVSQPDRQEVADQWTLKRAYALRAQWATKDLFFRSFNRLVQNISIKEPAVFVFNPDLWERSDNVQMDLETNRYLVDLTTGANVPMETMREFPGFRVVRFRAGKIPGLGYKAYGARTRKPPEAPVPGSASKWEIESRFYRVTLDPKSGAISQLLDKEAGRNLLDSSAPYRGNEAIVVRGGEGSRLLMDQVNFKPAQLEVFRQEGASLVANTGTRIRIRARSKGVSVIETEISVYDDLKRVDIVNRIQKDEVRAKEALYFAFPFRVSPPEVAYQIQNTWVRPNTDQLPGACRDWFTTQNLVVSRDAGLAIAWATPDAPLITISDINRGKWLKHLDVNNGHVFSYVMNNYWFTNYRAYQTGDHTFRYSITSSPSLSDEQLARFDAETRSPLIVYQYYDTGQFRLKPVNRTMPAEAGSFFNVDAANAQVTAFKEAEDGDGFILRLRETAGRNGSARLRSPVLRLLAAALCNGVEDTQTPLNAVDGTLEIPLKAHAFTTVRLRLRPKELPNE